MANIKKDKIRQEIIKLYEVNKFTYKQIAEKINKKFGTSFPDRQWVYYYIKSSKNE